MAGFRSVEVHQIIRRIPWHAGAGFWVAVSGDLRLVYEEFVRPRSPRSSVHEVCLPPHNIAQQGPRGRLEWNGAISGEYRPVIAAAQ